MICNNDKKQNGFSLLEIMIYIALLGGIAVFVINFLLHTVNVYQRSVAERGVVANGRLLLEFVNKTISESQEIYRPTSKFLDNAGQLSLVDAATSTPQHTTMYIDFWADNGIFYMKREGGATIALSAASVRVSRFYIEEIAQGLGRQAVKATIQVDSASKYPSSTTLNSTTALRGNY